MTGGRGERRGEESRGRRGGGGAEKRRETERRESEREGEKGKTYVHVQQLRNFFECVWLLMQTQLYCLNQFGKIHIGLLLHMNKSSHFFPFWERQGA